MVEKAETIGIVKMKADLNTNNDTLKVVIIKIDNVNHYEVEKAEKVEIIV